MIQKSPELADTVKSNLIEPVRFNHDSIPLICKKVLFQFTMNPVCKKLRYLMEFFSSLFTRQKINRLIEQLKKLQDNLGDFNDLCIQLAYLRNIAEELPMTRQKSKKTLVAIGSLIGSLDREKQKVRDAFATTFTNFASLVNKKLFRELFAFKKKEIIS